MLKKTGFAFLTGIFLVCFISLSFAGGKRGEKDFNIAVAEDTARDGRISVQIKAKKAVFVDRVEKQNKDYQTILFDSCLPTRKKGFPEVAYFRMAFQLRDNRNYKLVVQKLDFDERPFDGDWLPSRGQILRTMDPGKIPYRMENAALVDADYPGSEFVVPGEPFLIREVRGIALTIYPVLINMVQKRVKILREIKFELVPVEEGVIINQQPRRRLKVLSRNQPVFEALFSNFRWDDELSDGPGHMLVIYTARDRDAIQTFIAHKKSLGFTVAEQEVAKGTNVKDIIRNAYNADPELLYVQLVGDWADIQCEKIDMDGDLCYNPDGCPKDNALGLVAGSDDYYDLIISRFSAENAVDVTTQVNKVITYEDNPNQTWWKKGLGIASDEGPGDDDESDKEHVDIIKKNKLIPFGYTSVYDEYDPGALASGVTSAVNGGVHVINYVGHGDMYGWSTTSFDRANINALTNGSKLPFIFSVACSVGEYNGDTCFAETWLRKQEGGAVSALMSTISQPWDPPMRGQDYMNDLLTGGYDYAVNPGEGTSTNHGKVRMGSIVFNAFNLQIAEAGSGDVTTTQTWVLFGDGSLLVSASPCPDCSGDVVVLKNVTFSSGAACECTATESITIGPGVMVKSGANVVVRSPKIKMLAGVKVEEGATFKMGQLVVVSGSPVPDTEQTTCYDADGNVIACPSPGERFYGQDGNYTINPLSYTKLDGNGNALAASATSWVMVRDNVTGLIWEVKKNRDWVKQYDDPHDADNTYTWYDPDPATNGGDAGIAGDGTDTDDFINALNNARFGGYSDWRMPKREELRSICDYERIFNPVINTDYFPKTRSYWYWSYNTYAGNTGDSWSVHFEHGVVRQNGKASYCCVRAVRGGQ